MEKHVLLTVLNLCVICLELITDWRVVGSNHKQQLQYLMWFLCSVAVACTVNNNVSTSVGLIEYFLSFLTFISYAMSDILALK